MAIELYRREKCPLCESPDCRPLYRLAFSNKLLKQFLSEFYEGRIDSQLFKDETWIISQCDKCRFIFQVSVLNSEGQSALYGEWVNQDKSLSKKQKAKAKLFRQYAGQLQTISRLFDQAPHQIKMLEFGMGWGYWSRMASAFGFQVSGFELSQRRLAHARGLGVNVIDQLSESGPRFDFIYANQVFEHLEQPLQTLQQLQAYLNPGGIIYIRVPDGRSVRSHLAKQGWTPELDAVHPLEHINCFTRKTLRFMAAQAGLRAIKPPVRLELSRLWGGVKREINDRFFTTHLFFRRD